MEQNKLKYRIQSNLKAGTIIIATGALVLLAFFVIGYLKREKLFLYKTGIEKKAILNSTWNMSSKEIERANNVKLRDNNMILFFEPVLEMILDHSRISSKKGEAINLWSYSAELTYDFFDDRLFRYTLMGQAGYPDVFDSVALLNLGIVFGNFIPDSTQYKGKFIKDSVLVEYCQFNIADKEDAPENHFVIEVSYQPIYYEIIRTAKENQNSIFK